MAYQPQEMMVMLRPEKQLLPIVASVVNVVERVGFVVHDVVEVGWRCSGLTALGGLTGCHKEKLREM